MHDKLINFLCVLNTGSKNKTTQGWRNVLFTLKKRIFIFLIKLHSPFLSGCLLHPYSSNIMAGYSKIRPWSWVNKSIEVIITMDKFMKAIFSYGYNWESKWLTTG